MRLSAGICLPTGILPLTTVMRKGLQFPEREPASDGRVRVISLVGSSLRAMLGRPYADLPV